MCTDVPFTKVKHHRFACGVVRGVGQQSEQEAGETDQHLLHHSRHRLHIRPLLHRHRPHADGDGAARLAVHRALVAADNLGGGMLEGGAEAHAEGEVQPGGGERERG